VEARRAAVRRSYRVIWFGPIRSGFRSSMTLRNAAEPLSLSGTEAIWPTAEARSELELPIRTRTSWHVICVRLASGLAAV
jgi:hypothetical protein